MDMFDVPATQPVTQGSFDPMAALGGGSPKTGLNATPSKGSLGGGSDGPQQMSVVDAFAEMTPAVGGLSPGGPVSEESKSKIRAWEEEQNNKIQGKSDAELANKKRKREEASKQLQSWYAERKDKLSKKFGSNRKEENEWKALQLEKKPTNPWERVMSLITEPVATKEVLQHDITRFKQILIQLKANPVPN